MKTRPNERCPCGSGKKYKHCCSRRTRRTPWLAIAAVAIFGLLAAWVVVDAMRETNTPPGKVWSAEHGHWHDAETGLAENEPAIRPMGPAPPGKVWSEEHGHWHDAQNPGAVRPAGPPPPGQVWSEEHGHWHDVNTGLAVEEVAPPAEIPPPLPEEQVSGAD